VLRSQAQKRIKSFLLRGFAGEQKYFSRRKEFFFSQVALATKNSFRSAAPFKWNALRRIPFEGVSP
ncbi:MAG: hypothetical protein II045_01620, partial [Oscillospiraceae bacterium]|nr:hypothetical protein [Oscillospiraceae bacterium]